MSSTTTKQDYNNYFIKKITTKSKYKKYCQSLYSFSILNHTVLKVIRQSSLTTSSINLITISACSAAVIA